jgi:hypothetical protein
MDGPAAPFKAAGPACRFRFGAIVGHERRVRVVFLLAAGLLWATSARAQTDPLHRAVDSYALYQSDISDLLDADAGNYLALDSALERAARHDPPALARGWIAYGALTAVQSPAFVHGVQSRVRAAGRAAVLRQLRRDLTYARRRPPGSAEASRLVLAVIAADSARLGAAAQRYNHAARAFDLSTWTPPTDAQRGAREQRLRRSSAGSLTLELAARLHVSALAATPVTDQAAFGGRRFWDELAGRTMRTPPTPPQRVRPSRQQTLDRMLSLAALFALGATSQEMRRVEALLEDAPTRDCLALQQLQFRQCASVAHDPSEDAFCLARHGLAAPGQCFAAIAE